MSRDPEYYSTLFDLGVATRDELKGKELTEIMKIPVNELPDDVYYSVPANVKDKPENRTYFRYSKPPEKEMMAKLAVVNAKNFNTIRKCAVFFVIFIVFLTGLYIFSRL